MRLAFEVLGGLFRARPMVLGDAGDARIARRDAISKEPSRRSRTEVLVLQTLDVAMQPLQPRAQVMLLSAHDEVWLVVLRQENEERRPSSGREGPT